MPSLYATFYEHWRSNNREAFEPFLTRAFVDVLQRVSKSNSELIRDLVLSVLLNPTRRTSGTAADKAWDGLQAAIRSTDNFEWKPELPITVEQGRRLVDVYLSLNEYPTLIVENKVTAGFTEDQLKTYGTWLANSCERGTAALILLTHSTPPPEDFLDGQADYGVPLRSVCSWMQMWEWMMTIREAVRDPFTNGLVREFCSFLEEPT